MTNSKYNKILWSVFFLVLLCLFLSSFNFVFDNVTGLEAYSFFIALGLGAVFFLLSWLIYHIVSNRVYENISVQPLVYTVWTVLDVLAFLVIRILYFAGVIDCDKELGNIAMRAMIGSDGRLYFNLNDFDGIFSSLLSVFFKFFGNTYFALYFLQFLLMCGGFAAVYIGVRRLQGPMSACLCGLLIALMPFGAQSIAYGNSYNLSVLIFGLMLLMLDYFTKIVEGKHEKLIPLGIVGIISGIVYLNDNNMLIFVIAPLIIILLSYSDYMNEKLIKMGSFALGVVLGFVIPLIFDALAASVTIPRAFEMAFASRFSLDCCFNPAKVIFDPAGCVVLILAVMYMAVSYRIKQEDAFIFTLMAIVAGVQTILMGGYDNGGLYMILMICMMAMGGVGIRYMFCLEDGTEAQEDEDGTNRADSDILTEEELFKQPAEPALGDKKDNSWAKFDTDVLPVTLRDEEPDSETEKPVPEAKEPAFEAEKADVYADEPVAEEKDSSKLADTAADTEDSTMTESAKENCEILDDETPSGDDFENSRFKFESAMQMFENLTKEEDASDTDEFFTEEPPEAVKEDTPDFVENFDSISEAAPQYVDEHVDEEVNNLADSFEEFELSEADESQEANETEQETVEEEIEFIENPLPLPKKHEHREMDYGRIIPQGLMHYDHEVTPDKNHYDY